MNNKEHSDNFPKLDFIGVGTSRCGTTWIAKCLGEHPEICLPDTKETHFFDIGHEYEDGSKAYEGFFKECGGEKIRGEYCPEYIYDEGAISRIREALPNAKILISFRHPIDRAFSHFLYGKRKNEKPKHFSELFDNDPKGVIKGSYYGQLLEMVFKYFPEEQIYIMIHEEHQKNPEEFIQDLYSFLGVDHAFVPPSIRKEINKSKNRVYWFPPFEWLFSGRLKRRRHASWRVFVSVLKFLKLHKVLLFLRDVNRKQLNTVSETEEISKGDAIRLWEKYEVEIKKLEKLIGRRLDIWKGP